MTMLKNHDVQSVNLDAPVDEVFNFIAIPGNLPKWTVAFKKADENSAILVTPNGELQIQLETKVDRDSGIIDWHMTMPDGSLGSAYSRIVKAPDGKAIYSFVLLAPPGPLKEVEGTLEMQIGQLKKELQGLQTLFSK